ncbi:uncharacterized protein LOC108911592 [Anoplophora glabripennis]|uniref:uncharacterized protein LOC108911592 n=1 Tax=Anoplophora glabripennis TaxID=217634 RepID=UPI0008748DDB|nr:uncharacterized protein LOC108911592 [Anoplophora glabripennis]
MQISCKNKINVPFTTFTTGIKSEIYAQLTCRCVLIGNLMFDQLNYMVDFITLLKILLHGKTKPSEANIIEKLWDELTTALNALGSGPSKTKLQWKKTFIDWKSNTKEKARECYKSEQRTGGGEGDAKKMTPLEEKLVAILSWMTVNGTDVPEIGLDENRLPMEKNEKLLMKMKLMELSHYF